MKTPSINTQESLSIYKITAISVRDLLKSQTKQSTYQRFHFSKEKIVLPGQNNIINDQTFAKRPQTSTGISKMCTFEDQNVQNSLKKTI